MYASETRITEYGEQLWGTLAAERRLQEAHVALIAQNCASPNVLEAPGSVLTNDHAEGYLGKRYSGGGEHGKIAERFAIECATRLFGAAWAHLQPRSNSQVDVAVHLALLQPDDTIPGISLAHGGHHDHAAKVSFSGKLFNAVQYGVDDIDNPNVIGRVGETVEALCARLTIYGRPA